jgi:hypothetical protein
MSFKAELSLEGKTFRISNCEYKMVRETDTSGRPVAGVKYMLIQLVLDGSEDETLLFWAADPQKKVSGTLTFYRIDQESVLKEVKFEDAFCVVYNEVFGFNNNAQNNASYILKIQISSGKASIGGVNLEQ